MMSGRPAEDEGDVDGPAAAPLSLAFIGLGKIGAAICRNVVTKSRPSLVSSSLHYDVNPDASSKIEEETGGKSKAASSIAEAVSNADVIFTALPNDAILLEVSLGEGGVDSHIKEGAIHVSCSTVGPSTCRDVAKRHADRGAGFVGAPVFARPDGMALGRATIPACGRPDRVERVSPLLELTCTTLRNFGEDPGAASVVKLAGNFLIAASIESVAEALSLAEACGVDRDDVRSLLTDTIFDCLIYKGYGQRVARRDHAPYENAHFALELGRKDVDLVRKTAASVNVPMPIGGVLADRFSAAVAKGRSDLDWSAIGLGASEDAGVDVGEFVERCRRPDPEIDWQPPT